EGPKEGSGDEAQESRAPEAQGGADGAACEAEGLAEEARQGADEEGEDRAAPGSRRALVEAEGGNAPRTCWGRPPSSAPTRHRRGAHPAHRGRVAQAR